MGQMRGWDGLNLVCPHFEVYFLAFSTKCYFSINVSLGEMFTKFNKILV